MPARGEIREGDDFGVEIQRLAVVSAAVAIYRACLARFRPIMMTTLAAMLGALPLAVQAGWVRSPTSLSASLSPAGSSFFQGLTLFSTPVIDVALDQLRRRSRRPVAVLQPAAA